MRLLTAILMTALIASVAQAGEPEPDPPNIPELMKAGLHDRAYVAATTPEERLTVLTDASKSRKLNPLSCYLLAVEVQGTIAEMLGNNEPGIVDVCELMGKACKRVGNRELAERFDDPKTAVAEKLEGLDVVKGERSATREAKTVIGVDRHAGWTGAQDLKNSYFVKLRSPANVNGMRVQFQGKMGGAKLGTSEGKVSVSLNGKDWFEVSKWDTEILAKTDQIDGWNEFELSGPELMTVDRVAVKFDFTGGSRRLYVSQVGVVQ